MQLHTTYEIALKFQCNIMKFHAISLKFHVKFGQLAIRLQNFTEIAYMQFSCNFIEITVKFYTILNNMHLHDDL